MSGAHTPGPWQMIAPPYDSVPWLHVYGTDNGKHIMHIDRTTDEKVANARLIAAAPELLEALEELVRAVNTNELASAMACHSVASFANVGDALKAALPAIAKARGDA